MKAKLFLALALAAGLTHAHHSFVAAYDLGKTLTIEGKVVEFLFRSPHSFVQMEARDRTSWIVEWGGASELSRSGVSKDTLRPGDRVAVTGNPSRNPAGHKLRMVTIRRASDGWEWGAEAR